MNITLPWDCPYQENMEIFLKSLNYDVTFTETKVVLIEGFSIKDNKAAEVVWHYLWAKYHRLPLFPEITVDEYTAAQETLYEMAK